MRLLYLHRTGETRAGNTCIATVDIEIDENVRLYGLRLMRMKDGKHLVFAPQAGQRRAATFSPAFAERLTDLAVAEWERAA